MLPWRIKPFLLPTTFIARRAPKSVTVINRKNIWTNHQNQHNAENEKFHALFPDVVSTLSKTETLKIFPELGEFVKKLFEYNSAGGKKIRGLMTVTAYQMLEKPENITEESLRLARVLGWCVELLQTFFHIQYDIIDNSSTRHGSVCWYQLPDVGMRALNDTSFVISLLMEYIKYNFGGKKYYSALLDVFNEAILQITLGQHFEAASARNISSFTEENYNKIANFKMTYYTYKLPVYVSLLLANKSHEGVYKNEEDLLHQMGILTSMQKDFMDCFDEESESGKAGTAIQEGKCTWLAVQALARCTPVQREELEACYGAADVARVRRVQRLYERLQLPALYRETERAAYDSILKRIDAIPKDNVVPPDLIRKLFHTVYHLWDNSETRPYLGGVH